MQQIHNNLDSNLKNISDDNQKDESYLLSKVNYAVSKRDTTRGSTNMPVKKPHKELFVNKFLLLIKEK